MPKYSSLFFFRIKAIPNDLCFKINGECEYKAETQSLKHCQSHDKYFSGEKKEIRDTTQTTMKTEQIQKKINFNTKNVVYFLRL